MSADRHIAEKPPTAAGISATVTRAAQRHRFGAGLVTARSTQGSPP